MLCRIHLEELQAWFHSYDHVQSLALLLLYLQVLCALIGSLGALYTGVLLVNLAVALFALVAIESGSQTLGRTYAALLVAVLLLEIVWFILFSYEIRGYEKSKNIGKFTAFSLKLVLWMQIIGFTLRVLSSFLWFQMYRLGPSYESSSFYQPLAYDGRPVSQDITPMNSPGPHHQLSLDEDIIGGSIYDPTYYASLFEGSRLNTNDATP